MQERISTYSFDHQEPLAESLEYQIICMIMPSVDLNYATENIPLIITQIGKWQA
jgi:hypothetical protein